jgi:hypothetical protein
MLLEIKCRIYRAVNSGWYTQIKQMLIDVQYNSFSPVCVYRMFALVPVVVVMYVRCRQQIPPSPQGKMVSLSKSGQDNIPYWRMSLSFFSVRILLRVVCTSRFHVYNLVAACMQRERGVGH